MVDENNKVLESGQKEVIAIRSLLWILVMVEMRSAIDLRGENQI